MKGLIIYFSGTGNTKYIAEVINKELTMNNHQTSIYSMEDNPNIPNDSYDFLVLGVPKYCEYLPMFFVDYIKKAIPKNSTPTKTLLFCTAGGNLKTGYKALEDILNEKNHFIVISKSLRMPNNYFIGGIFKPKSEEKNNKYIETSTKIAKELAQDFINENYHKESIGKFRERLLKSLAVKFKEQVSKTAENFTISQSCTKCELCVKNCPTNNISLVNDTINFHNKCISCLRCINICPFNSIGYKNKTLPQYRTKIKLITKEK